MSFKLTVSKCQLCPAQLPKPWNQTGHHYVHFSFHDDFQEILAFYHRNTKTPALQGWDSNKKTCRIITELNNLKLIVCSLCNRGHCFPLKLKISHCACWVGCRAEGNLARECGSPGLSTDLTPEPEPSAREVTHAGFCCFFFLIPFSYVLKTQTQSW